MTWTEFSELVDALSLGEGEKESRRDSGRRREEGQGDLVEEDAMRDLGTR